MPQNALTLLEILRDLLLGAAAGLAGGFVRWNNPERRRFGWCLAWEVPSAALVGSAGYALGGFLEFNEYGRFLFAFSNLNTLRDIEVRSCSLAIRCIQPEDHALSGKNTLCDTILIQLIVDRTQHIVE